MLSTAAFSKMCGAGNDFLITDKKRFDDFLKNNKEKPGSEPLEGHLHSHSDKNSTPHSFSNHYTKQIPFFCDRKFGIGADGFCYLDVRDDNHIEWNFFNSDGSKAMMCGNAACCIIDYAYKRNLVKKSKPLRLNIENTTLIGQLDSSGQAKVQCPLPQIQNQNSSITIDQASIAFSKVNFGVSHIVVDDHELSHLIYNNKSHQGLFTPDQLQKLRPLAQKLRKKAADSNITFYRNSQSSHIQGITFEKGVEDFTLACGTGALAIGYLFSKDNKTPLPMKIKMQSEALEVDFDKTHSYLKSPVYFIAEIFPYI